MNCPKCGRGNPDGAKFCNFCGNQLIRTPPTHKRVDVKISSIAVVSFASAIASTVTLALSITFNNTIIDYVFSGLIVSAFIAGIVSLVQIELSRGKTTGLAFAVVGVMIPVLFFLLIFGRAVLYRPRMVAFRMTCGINLSRIGKAMYIYACDFDDRLPQAGGPGTRWTGHTPKWDASDRPDAFGLNPDGTGGNATVSSSLYLLVKYAEVATKIFICDKERGVKEFKLADYPNRNAACKDLVDAWDFGPNPAKHCSYSYHMPYGKYPLTTRSKPALAVAADRNPWFDSPAAKAKNFSRFKPDVPPYNGDVKQARYGNSIAHKEDGQNVLFLDSRVNFENRSYGGVNDDNIYTYWADGDKSRGTAPVVGSEPVDKLDSLLVNDPPIMER
jgi:hypothetical protein